MVGDALGGVQAAAPQAGLIVLLACAGTCAAFFLSVKVVNDFLERETVSESVKSGVK